MQPNGSTKHAALCAELDSAQATVTAAQRHLLEVIAECDRAEMWRADGYRDLAKWLSARVGISNWAARRWIQAAHALPTLPHLSAALEAGTLSIDKIVELCRFATPETERRLIRWAQRVTVTGIRRKADLASRGSEEDAVEADRSDGSATGGSTTDGASDSRAACRLTRGPSSPGPSTASPIAPRTSSTTSRTHLSRQRTRSTYAEPTPSLRWRHERSPTIRTPTARRSWSMPTSPPCVGTLGDARSRAVRSSTPRRRAGSHAMPASS
jgi:Domain of unknown function (DUF222)